MKKSTLYAISSLLFLAPANAAFASGIVPTDSYNTIKAMYQHRDLDGYATNGFAFGYVHGFSLDKKVPVFLQTGIMLDMGFNSEKIESIDEDSDSSYEIKAKLTTMSISVPLDLAYKFVLGENRNIAIKPYAGINFKVNVKAQEKISTYGYDGYKWHDIEEKFDLFDSEVGMKHFQAGWHIGFGIQFSKFEIGAEYGADFNRIANDANHTPTFRTGIGFSF